MGKVAYQWGGIDHMLGILKWFVDTHNHTRTHTDTGTKPDTHTDTYQVQARGAFGASQERSRFDRIIETEVTTDFRNYWNATKFCASFVRAAGL